MDIISALIITLKISVISTLLSFVFSIFFSFLSMRFKYLSFPINIIATLPLALPPVVTGYFLIFVSRGSLSFHWMGGSIACAIIALPLVYRTMLNTFYAIDFSIFNTARIFGANKFQAFYYVIFPNIRNGIFSAIFLGFMRSISEFGASMVIAGNISGETQTLSSAIFTAIQIGDSNKIFLLSFISILLAILTIMTFSIINKNRRFIF